jgi:ferredoxin-thioredoxin reductase catalytic chain
MEKQSISEALKDKIHAYASENGYQVNEKNLDNIVAGLIENNEEFGDYYCPCRVVRDNEKYRKAIICPCVFVPKEIQKMGHCTCLLYYSKDADPATMQVKK